MNTTDISLIIIILMIPGAFALDFSLSSPTKAIQDQKFMAEIISSDQIDQDYDVKIFVHEAKKDFSEIFFDDSWNSPHYYLIGAFPSETEFTILSHYVGDTQICVRLRKTGETSFEEICENIIVELDSNSKQDQVDEDIDNNSEDREDEEVEEELDVTESQSTQNGVSEKGYDKEKQIPKPRSDPNKEKITLSAPTSTSKQNTISNNNLDYITTSKQKTNLYFFYSFTVLCIFIIILLSFKRL